MEQRCQGTLQVWGEPFTVLRIPKIYNLRADPFERADITSNTYWDWYLSKGYMIMVAQGLVAPFLATFKEFPPRQRGPALPSTRRWKRWRLASAAPDTEIASDKYQTRCIESFRPVRRLLTPV
jgi:hypothetical protein